MLNKVKIYNLRRYKGKNLKISNENQMKILKRQLLKG